MNWIRERTVRRELVVGTWLNLGSSVVAEIAGRAGFDWVVLDLEHGHGDQESLLPQLQGLSASPTAPLVRVAWNEAPRVKRVLDLGAAGVIFPCVGTAEEARLAAAAMRYPPDGCRGCAATRASGYGTQLDDYLACANEQLLTVVQIETAATLSHLDAIAAVEGVDVLFVGPMDLSFSLGVPRQYDHPVFREAVTRVSEAARRAGKAAGILLLRPDQFEQALADGYTFLGLGSDMGVMVEGMRKNAAVLGRAVNRPSVVLDTRRLNVYTAPMAKRPTRNAPGRVRDAIVEVLSQAPTALPVTDIQRRVSEAIGPTPASSVRSYLGLNTPDLFVREAKGLYRVRRAVHPSLQPELLDLHEWRSPVQIGQAMLIHADCLKWLEEQSDTSIQAVVTDPPYGLHEYTSEQQAKLRNGKGGVWRIPPSYDGHERSPLPRFTVLTSDQLEELRRFFLGWAQRLLPKLVPGANVLIASNPLLSYLVSGAVAEAGLERRGEIIRLVMTMRGGDRPKAAHEQFPEVSVMPRSMWEPWLVFRKPIEGRVQDNLRRWGTGGFRRPFPERPFGDVISSAPTRKDERALAPHPSLKPQAFLRQIVRAVLPLGEGVVVDPFAGSGSTLAAAEAVGYRSVGIEKDQQYFVMACEAIPRLARFKIGGGL